jgi:hypothetical protein
MLTVRNMNERQYDPSCGPPGFESESELLSEAMRILGKRTSERKKASSRANAKRPRKAKKQTVSNSKAKSADSDFSREKITTNNT